ncbi:MULTISPECIES: hypothetical protein [Emticicia]|uniref:hypothetical protein n=1 Tax=Emticicia TaxID=312278 RepID=UPI0007D8A417|nr:MULTISPECIES: hypothetical protein [Emticicia]
MITRLRLQPLSVNKKPVNPIIGIILLLVSIILSIITLPLGIIWGIIYTIYKKSIQGLGEYCLEIAISIDQLGNVIMQHLLNLIWITKKSENKFGNRDETISSVLGKNKRDNTLTRFGIGIANLLDSIDENHVLNSIDYHIEPVID